MTLFFRPDLETATQQELEQHQLDRLRKLLAAIAGRNRFYSEALRRADLAEPSEVDDLSALQRLPFTRKDEIARDQTAHPPFGSNLTYPLDRYVRLHQTSGTSSGRPIRWLDTPESWAWWAELWGYVYTGAGVGPGDRVFFAFSFGPFIGFWSAFAGAAVVGALAVPGGGQDSHQRLRSLLENEATVLLCTPTYALRLAEVAREQGVDLRSSAVRVTIHAGEPGASIPATRRRIEDAWEAKCHDHTGLTEVGATGFTCAERSGVHLIESEFIFEVIDPASDSPVPAGQLGELVVTNLGRAGMPLLRYRTGDLVVLDRSMCPCGRTFARLQSGILGRVDDMLIVRGINVFPGSIEEIVRGFEQVEEFRIELRTSRGMSELRLLIEPGAEHSDGAPDLVQRVSQELHRRLLLRVDCQAVAPSSLPRFELKARRFHRVDAD